MFFSVSLSQSPYRFPYLQLMDRRVMDCNGNAYLAYLYLRGWKNLQAFANHRLKLEKIDIDDR